MCNLCYVRFPGRPSHNHRVRETHYVEKERLAARRIGCEAAQGPTVDRVERSLVANEAEQECSELLYPARHGTTSWFGDVSELAGKDAKRTHRPIVKIEIIAREQLEVCVDHASCWFARGITGVLRSGKSEHPPQSIEKQTGRSGIERALLREDRSHRKQSGEQATDKTAGIIALAVDGETGADEENDFTVEDAFGEAARAVKA